MTKLARKINKNYQDKNYRYSKFKKIDGSHPFQDACPHSCVLYRARKRKGGKVAFFNFELAKEMGLISNDHPNIVTEELEKSILETFSLVIINEYDEINNIQFPEEDILPNKYMATRYLQLQHPNKQGKTSGDGRSIWNGQVSNKGVTWDISSCGTGATRLSPATHIKNKFFQTGDPSISYGCGYSEKDEGLATLFFSEILNRNGMSTERCLGIIEFQGGISINIRAHENLIRPSHMFRHMKLGEYSDLKDVVHYYIDRQIENKEWNDVPKTEKARFRYFLEKQIEVFAKLSADLEDQYIFCWLDWDGDNVLMDGGIIDYGSIRQFGLFHHEYRYDDVERYSTTIKEQKEKAKHTVATFEQIYDFLMTREKKSIKEFKSSDVQKKFNEIFEQRKNENLLYKIGLEKDYVDYLLKNETDKVYRFRKVFSYFERAKSIEGLHQVADGINWSAIFCMRDILRELPQIYLARGEAISQNEFIEIAKSNYATPADLEINSYRERMISKFQNTYLELLDCIETKYSISTADLLLKITMRSSVINKYDRVTGDSITKIVEQVLKRRPKFSPEELQEVLKDFTEYQMLDPDHKKKAKPLKNHSRFMKGMLKVVRDYREGL